jgi:hypothetical protein
MLDDAIHLIVCHMAHPCLPGEGFLSSHGLPDRIFWEDYNYKKCTKCLILLVPVERIELPTFGLQNRCSTAELNRHLADVSKGFE